MDWWSDGLGGKYPTQIACLIAHISSFSTPMQAPTSLPLPDPSRGPYLVARPLPLALSRHHPVPAQPEVVEVRALGSAPRFTPLE